MHTLEERLEQSGYYEMLAQTESDRRLVESARLDAKLSGREMSPEMLKFEESLIAVEIALADEYEATVKRVDAVAGYVVHSGNLLENEVLDSKC